MNTLTRFMFVCIWKQMRQMDDNLLVRIATIQAIVISLLFVAASWLQLQHQLTIPVSFFFYFFSWLRSSPTHTYIIKFTSGLYWSSAISNIFWTIFITSFHSICLHSYHNWTNDLNTKEPSHWKIYQSARTKESWYKDFLAKFVRSLSYS